MKYTIIKKGNDPIRDQIASEVAVVLAKNNFEEVGPEEKLNFIFNLIDFENVEAVRRKRKDEFVVSVARLPKGVEDIRFLAYNSLVKSLSNLFLAIQDRGNRAPRIYCITPEVGFYNFEYAPDKIWKAMSPVVAAHFDLLG